MDKLRCKKINLAKCEENWRKKQETVLCFRENRMDSSEIWIERRHIKERCKKWKSLSNFGEALGKEKKERQTCRG